MSILLIPRGSSGKIWLAAFQQADPSVKIEVWPQVQNFQDVLFAAVWHYPAGELLKYPNLKCIASIGAGVDHIMQDTKRPANVPVVRVIDAMLTRDMTQYVALAVLDYCRRFAEYLAENSQKKWQPRPMLTQPTVGIMGLGQLGQDAARKLVSLGFRMNGWGRTAKQIDGVKSFAGAKQFGNFLGETDILVCLLPLTPATKNILNRTTFSQLRKGAYIINVARGDHLVENDLLAAIDSGQLAGACLDVFAQEPLPVDHPFWQYPKIKITPHIASVTNPFSVAQQLLENYHRLLAGQPLLNEIDVILGY